MPDLERIPKPSTKRSKTATSPAKDQSTSGNGQLKLASDAVSADTLIQLQQTVGNYAVQRMLTVSQTGAMQKLPLDVDTQDTPSSANGQPIQREIKKLPGASSGFFRKGRRDKINDMVEAYNTLEMGAVGSKATVANIQKLLPEIQKIWQAAHAWQVEVMKKNPDKAASIADWIKKEVEREEDAKKAAIGELQEAAALKAASDGATYNAAYTTAEYTVALDGVGAGVMWLRTPALAPIYKYYLIQLQHEAVTLKAFEEMVRYRAAPSRAEALRIYNEYAMEGSDKLNIAGEGVQGGIASVNRVRQEMRALAADANAAAPASFSAIEQSVTYVINELFIGFRATEPFKKVTTAPATG